VHASCAMPNPAGASLLAVEVVGDANVVVQIILCCSGSFGREVAVVRGYARGVKPNARIRPHEPFTARQAKRARKLKCIGCSPPLPY
jgi:hypothetical protein